MLTKRTGSIRIAVNNSTTDFANRVWRMQCTFMIRDSIIDIAACPDVMLCNNAADRKQSSTEYYQIHNFAANVELTLKTSNVGCA